MNVKKIWESEDGIYEIETTNEKIFFLFNVRYKTRISSSTDLKTLLDWVDRDWRYQPITDTRSKVIRKAIEKLSDGELSIRKTETDTGYTLWQVVSDILPERGVSTVETIVFQSKVLVDLLQSVKIYYQDKELCSNRADFYKIEKKTALPPCSTEFCLINTKYGTTIKTTKTSREIREFLQQIKLVTPIFSPTNYLSEKVKQVSFGNLSVVFSYDLWCAIDKDTSSIVLADTSLLNVTRKVKQLFEKKNVEQIA